MINAMTDFNIVNFPLLDGDVPRRPSYVVYISHLRFARVCSLELVSKFNVGFFFIKAYRNQNFMVT